MWVEVSVLAINSDEEGHRGITAGLRFLFGEFSSRAPIFRNAAQLIDPGVKWFITSIDKINLSH